MNNCEVSVHDHHEQICSREIKECPRYQEERIHIFVVGIVQAVYLHGEE